MPDTDLHHRILTCVDCGEEFVFTVAAQEYFEKRGFQHSPRRCKTCHIKHKREQKFAPPPTGQSSSFSSTASL